MLVYYGILFVGALIQPLLAAAALAGAFASRSLRQALLGGLVAGGVGILFDRLADAHPIPVVIMLMAGITVCVLAFLVRRELGIPSLFEKRRPRD